MQKGKSLLLILILGLLFLIPFVTIKAVGKGFCPYLEGGLVPCGRQTDDPRTAICECLPCGLCHITILFKRIVDFAIIKILVPLAILMIVVGGVMLLISGGDPERIISGKKILTSVAIGLVIVFVAWIIVNTIVFFASEKRLPLPGEVGTVLGQPWNKINCPYCGDRICQDGNPPGEPNMGENFMTCPYDCMNFLWVPLSAIDKIAQIDLADGSIIDTYDVGDDPSRLTVFPGGDVWVANRKSANVTRLSPDPDNLPHYKVIGSYPVGGGPRAVTYDVNGFLWVGNAFDDTVMKLDPETGNQIIPAINVGGGGFSLYGAIGDPFGYVWFANRSGSKVDIIDANTNTFIGSVPLPNARGDTYGIGMDNEGDIWVVENADDGRFCELIGMKNPTLAPADRYDPARCYTTGAGGDWGKARGIAVDGNNNVWVVASSDSHVYVFDPSGHQLCNIDTGGGGPVGVAIDFNNNGHVVGQATGMVYSYYAIGHPKQCQLIFPPIDVGDSPYNYSDMTGFRSKGCPRPR